MFITSLLIIVQVVFHRMAYLHINFVMAHKKSNNVLLIYYTYMISIGNNLKYTFKKKTDIYNLYIS